MKISFKNKGEEKTAVRYKKLRELIADGGLLQDVLRRSLRQKENDTTVTCRSTRHAEH